MDERYLVTGALGCIGAWALKTLVGEGAYVVALDVAAHAPRLDLILSSSEHERVQFLVGDIGDLATVESVLDEHGITRVIHLAALQIPFCRADPPLGALVNVVGTVNVLEAAKRRRDRIAGLVYASSVAVFAADDAPPGEAVRADAPAHPLTHYGVYKQANEGTARVYWHENGLSSVGLRPAVVYGLGRDQGLTSAPTKAMLAAVRGEPFHIEYGGRSQLQLAADVARSFVSASRSGYEGAGVFNLPGSVVHVREVIAAIEAAVPEAAGRVTFDDVPLPFPEELASDTPDGRLGLGEPTPFEQGVGDTIAAFRALAAEGRL